MNKICENCDTRIRLKMCEGRDGYFRYCFRKCGSIEGTKETIFPFNCINELYCMPIIKEWNVKNLKVENYGDYIEIVLGEYQDGTIAPVGFITKDIDHLKDSISIKCKENKKDALIIYESNGKELFMELTASKRTTSMELDREDIPKIIEYLWSKINFK